MGKIIGHEEYVKASILIESLIDKLDDSTPKDDPKLKQFIDASNIVEQYEKMYFPVGLPSLIDVIRLRMFEMRMKNKDLAALLGTNPVRISEYLNGKREITLNIARALNKKLNIDSDIILNG